MHLARIAELLLQRGGRGGLQKFTEAGSRVGEPPRWDLNVKEIQSLKRPFLKS
jgi:hypothetical protein